MGDKPSNRASVPASSSASARTGSPCGAARPASRLSQFHSPSISGSSQGRCGSAHSSSALASGAVAGSAPAVRSISPRTISSSSMSYPRVSQADGAGARVDVIPVEWVRCGGGGCRPAANVVGRLRERPETADPCTAMGGKVEQGMSPYDPAVIAGYGADSRKSLRSQSVSLLSPHARLPPAARTGYAAR